MTERIQSNVAYFTEEFQGANTRVLYRIYRWGRSPEWPKATSFLGGSGCKKSNTVQSSKMRYNVNVVYCLATMLQDEKKKTNSEGLPRHQSLPERSPFQGYQVIRKSQAKRLRREELNKVVTTCSRLKSSTFQKLTTLE